VFPFVCVCVCWSVSAVLGWNLAHFALGLLVMLGRIFRAALYMCFLVMSSECARYLFVDLHNREAYSKCFVGAVNLFAAPNTLAWPVQTARYVRLSLHYAPCDRAVVVHRMVCSL
jgi:hypothetical protein